MNSIRIALLVVISLGVTNCTNSSKAKDEESANWYLTRNWYKGLNITPHESINKQEFTKQYEKNPRWWDEAYEFLKSHNLNTLAPGKYIIDSNNVFATISIVMPKVKDSTNWEVHRNFNDLQYVIEGKAQMGIVSITDLNAKVIVPYTSEDNETFSVLQGRYYDAEPGTFFIFTPQEIHRPAFKIDGYDSIKKVVIKIRVP